MKMKTLVFAVAGYNLAETGRMIEIAKAARKHFADSGLAGIASAEALPPGRLPYADNLVNLLVAEDLPALIGAASRMSDAQLSHLAKTLAGGDRKTPVLPEPNGDFFGQLAELTDGQRGVAAEVHAFMHQHVAPIMNEYWNRDEFPHQIIPEMRRLDLLRYALRMAQLSSADGEPDDLVNRIGSFRLRLLQMLAPGRWGGPARIDPGTLDRRIPKVAFLVEQARTAVVRARVVSEPRLDAILADKRFALILGGAAGSGYVFLGVLERLEQMGIRPDYLVGCSVGSILAVIRARTRAFELRDGHRSGDVIAEAAVDPGLDELPWPQGILSRMAGEDFFRQSHRRRH